MAHERRKPHRVLQRQGVLGLHTAKENMPAPARGVFNVSQREIPMDLRTAILINTKVREFYGIKTFSPDVKSNNKRYADSSPSSSPSSSSMLDSKKNTRNNHLARSETLKLEQLACARKEIFTLYQMGGHLFNRPQGFRAGNCGEMAMLAVYMAVQGYGQRAEESFVCTTQAPKEMGMRHSFGHQFAFFGDRNVVQDGNIVSDLFDQVG
jgi:hypothetical protein